LEVSFIPIELRPKKEHWKARHNYIVIPGKNCVNNSIEQVGRIVDCLIGIQNAQHDPCDAKKKSERVLAIVYYERQEHSPF
jgi:hypothetical protein